MVNYTIIPPAKQKTTIPSAPFNQGGFLIKWINKQKSMPEQPRQPEETPETAEIKEAWNNVFEKHGEVLFAPQEDMPRIAIEFEKKGIKRVLDLGCGSGRHSIFLAEHGFDVCGIDASPEGIKIAGKKLGEKKLEADLKVGDIYEKLPYPDGSFGAIVSTRAMHHNTIEKIRELIKEMERILAPGGMVFITVPKRNDGRDEKEIAPDTFVPLSGEEKGLTHYYFNEATLRKEFGDFSITDIWEESKGGHYCLLGELKKEK